MWTLPENSSRRFRGRWWVVSRLGAGAPRTSTTGVGGRVAGRRRRPEARRTRRSQPCRRPSPADPQAAVRLRRFRGSALARLAPQPPGTAAGSREAASIRTRRTRRSQPCRRPTRADPQAAVRLPGVSRHGAARLPQPPGGGRVAGRRRRSEAAVPGVASPVGDRAERTRKQWSPPCLRCGGFEARRLRASHLNHRGRRAGSREAASIRSRRTRRSQPCRRPSRADPLAAVGLREVSRLGACAPRTSTTGMRPGSREAASTRARRTRRSQPCRRPTRADPQAAVRLPGFRDRRCAPSSTTGGGRQPGRRRRPETAVPA